MKKPDLGTKRKCESCNTKFYDLNRDPITCPECKAVLIVEPKVELESASSKLAENKTEVEEVKQPADGPEIISLEEVDSDQLGADIQGIEDDDENIGNEAESTFIESDDESDMAEIVTESDDDAEN